MTETSERDDRRHEGRVTLDIDGYKSDMRLTAIGAYHQLDRLADDVDVAISSGGSGLHIVGWFCDPLTFGERIKMRRTLGDDCNRIKIDIERAVNGIYTGVLWSEKSDGGTKQRGFADVYDALDALDGGERLVSDRVQNYANHGHKAEPSLAPYVNDPR